MNAKKRVWAKHVPAAIAAGVGLGLAGPFALLAVPLIPLWWRKAAKDAVSADLEDEMEADGVRKRLSNANMREIREWEGLCGDDEAIEVSRTASRVRKHPVFGVEGSYSMTETDRGRRH